MYLRKTITLLTLSSTIAQADDIRALGDEFNSAVTQYQWRQLNDTEGWNANQLELWDLNPSYAPGHMIMAPHSSAWFMDLRGVLVYKEVSGNFIITMRMRVTRRGANGTLPTEASFMEQSGAPSRQFSLAGIFIRNPRNITNAAPSPTPLTAPTWPPPAEGQPGYYSTDWTPDGDNYIFLSYGSAGNQNSWQYEVKTTTNGNSNLYYNSHGIPNDPNDAQIVTLQIIRVGNTIVTMRKHAEEPWIVENRYTQTPSSPYQQLPNFGNTLQVGITTYTDWNSIQSYYANGDHASQFQHNYTVFNTPSNNPDLIAYIDYYRLQRPDPAITEQSLLDLPITFTATPLGGTLAQALPATGAGIYLGDNANTPTPSLEEDSDNDGASNLLEAITGTNPTTPNQNPIQSFTTTNNFQLTFPHQNNLNPLTIEIQSSNSLLTEDWITQATRTSSGWTFEPPHNISETPNHISFTTPLTSTNLFYRLRTTTE